MSFRNLDIKISYISYGESSIAPAFLVPALKETKLYQRSVGFFSSRVLETIIDGIVALARNGGSIQLIASPRLSEADVAAINEGYRKKEDVLDESFSRDFLDAIEGLNDNHLKLLASLIAQSILDIKIVVTKSTGIYHDKLGILEDFEGNTIVFYGSSNSSLSGYKENYEKIRVVKSWEGNNASSIDDEKAEFASLWNGTNPFVDVYSYKQSAQKRIIEVIERRGETKDKPAPVKLRDYQEEAIQAWFDNGCKGFYVMATGTGKTWTAIYTAKRLLDEHTVMPVIIAPYKHLVKQWAEDVEKAFPNSKIILVSSENPIWESQIVNEIIRKKYNSNNQIIVISTIKSFSSERFRNAINKSDEKKMLIVDEAHRFSPNEQVKQDYYYLLGLSATPFSGQSAQKGLELMAFFGGQVFSLPIEKALGKFLVNYYYRPIYVDSTEDEESRFRFHSQKIASCFRNNVCINPDLLVKSLRNRLRVISMAEEKVTRIDEIVNHIEDKDHVVVYCGDGKLFDSNSNEEMRHIRFVKGVLDKHGYKPSQFTAKESMSERMALVEEFNKGNITALSAIRCLDEGINIPSIKSALILSSNDDYREFVQRRGRILRKYDNKDTATIYDVIVLPSENLQMWAKIEMRRFLEYAKLALNWDELEPELTSYLVKYGLSIEDIDVYDYEDLEEPLDE